MTKARVLIVDDEPAPSTLVRMYLEETGLYDVVVENLSYQALATARRFKPEVVLLDVNMPGKDGGDVAAEIRADGQLAGTPIVFFTSLVSPEEAEDRKPSRNRELFLSKKADPALVVRTIASVLEQEAAAKPVRIFVDNSKASNPPEPIGTSSDRAPHDRIGF